MGRLATLLVFALAAAAARADTVTLRNGRTVQGLVTEESLTTVCVSTEAGEYVFSAAEVASVSRDGPLAVAGAQGRAGGGGGEQVEVVRQRGAKASARDGRGAQVIELDEADAAAQARARALGAVREQAARRAPTYQGRVTVYGTSWCGFCKLARSHLRSRGVSFQDLDVEKDPAAAAAFLSLRRKHGLGGGVPVLVMGEQVIPGFDRARIDAILDGN